MLPGTLSDRIERGDVLLVSDVIRTNEMEVWFLAEHLVETPVVHAT